MVPWPHLLHLSQLLLYCRLSQHPLHPWHRLPHPSQALLVSYLKSEAEPAGLEMQFSQVALVLHARIGNKYGSVHECKQAKAKLYDKIQVRGNAQPQRHGVLRSGWKQSEHVRVLISGLIGSWDESNSSTRTRPRTQLSRQYALSISSSVRRPNLRTHSNISPAFGLSTAFSFAIRRPSTCFRVLST
jgi:hypothetical protein